MQEDSGNPSPDGAEEKTADRENDYPGAGIFQISAHASSEKNSPRAADQKLEIQMIESAMLPAPVVDVSVRDPRHQRFKDLIFRMFWEDRGTTCPWDDREGKQLKDLLVTYPHVDEREFAQWLENYMFSEDRTPGQRPYRFLPRMDRYTIEPLDRFGRGISTACR